MAAANPTDGQFYCNGKTVPSTNADTDLGTPIPLAYAQAVAAIVELTITGAPATTSIFFVLQTDMGDGNWIDIGWVVTTATGAAQLFYISGGTSGAIGFAQTRVAGAAPASNGQTQAPMGARFRFIGRATFTGGTNPAATATIIYKPLGLR